MTALSILIPILAALLIWGVFIYNRLVGLRNLIANAWAQIDVQLKRRHDLIPNLVQVAERYLKHEKDTLQAVIAARGQAAGLLDAACANPASAAGAAAITQLAVGEAALMGSLGRLMAVAENYPELKADQSMRELSEEITSTENRVGFARQAYNDAVLDLNNAVQAFPAVLVARLTGFALAAPLESTTGEAERAAPQVHF